MPRPPAPCGTESAYKRHMRKKEPVDEACRAAVRDAARSRSGRADDEEQSAPVISLHGAFTAASGASIDAKERLIANMQLVERAMESIAEADPLKIVQLSKRHSELVAELVAVSGQVPGGVEKEADPFAFLGNASRGAAPAPRKSS